MPHPAVRRGTQKKNEGPPPRSPSVGMSRASHRTAPGSKDPTERLQSRIAALVTALVHLLLALLVMLAPPITTSSPQGGAAGGRMAVTYIDESLDVPPPPVQKPTVRRKPQRKPRKATPESSRVRTTLVVQSDDAVPDTSTPVDEPPGEPPATPPEPPRDTPPRPPQRWGQPPGMLPQDLAPVNAGTARSTAVDGGRRNDAPTSGGGLEVGGYQVYYDLLDEARLRAWREQGMTELFLPLPGTRRLMVCPLETALHRESGACRLVEPDSPELKAIGDARDVIVTQRIDHLGDVLWRGPGAYR
jgi:hypothetical protein